MLFPFDRQRGRRKNREIPISEYAIAVEVLDRRPDFDPRIDATVRVHISRLRQKLKEFYATEGAGVPLLLSIPVGTRHLEVERLDASACNLATPRTTGPQRQVAIAVLALLAATAASLFLWRENHRLHSALRGLEAARTLPRLWQGVVGNGKPTMLVYPNPVFYQWGSLRVRDVRITELEPEPQAGVLCELTAKLGRSVFSQSFSIAADALAAVSKSPSDRSFRLTPKSTCRYGRITGARTSGRQRARS